MKKSRIFMAAGTLVLAVTAIFATKANKKFTTVTTAVMGLYHVHGPSGSIAVFTTKGAAGEHQLNAKLYTSGGTISGAALVTKEDNTVYYY